MIDVMTGMLFFGVPLSLGLLGYGAVRLHETQAPPAPSPPIPPPAAAQVSLHRKRRPSFSETEDASRDQPVFVQMVSEELAIRPADVNYSIVLQGGSSLTKPAQPADGALPENGMRLAQERLHSLGLYGGPIDGSWRPATKNAIGLFQITRGLEHSGELTRATADAMGIPFLAQAVDSPPGQSQRE